MSYYALTYYTNDVPIYVDAFQLWLEDINRVGMKHHAFAQPSKGDRQRNCLEKIQVIYRAMMLHGLPLLWIDVDSRIMKRPAFLDKPIEHDFMGRRNPTKPQNGWAGSVLYFADSAASREMIRRMKLIADRNPQLHDECVIREAGIGMEREGAINIGSLPETCFTGHTTSTVKPSQPGAEIAIACNSAWWSRAGLLGVKDKRVVLPEFVAA